MKLVSKLMMFLLSISLVFNGVSYAATSTYNKTSLKTGYYVTADGTVGVLIQKSSIIVYDMYDSSSDSLYSTEKDALKSTILKVSKENANKSGTKYSFKKVNFYLDKKGNLKFLLTNPDTKDSDALPLYYGGTSYSAALKLAKKKLDSEFS